MVNKKKYNKKGWVKVVEVFFSIILVMGVILVIVNKNNPSKDISDQVHEMESSMIYDIQLNNTLRGEVLYADVPTNWSGFNSTGLTGVRAKIIEKKLSSFDCEAKICSVEGPCFQDSVIDKDVYVESIIISSDLNVYNPRQLKIFCWQR